MLNIIAEEAVNTAPSINEENKYFPIIIDADGTSFQIVNNGTAAAPCRVTIVPKNDIMLLSIEGLSDEKIEVHKVHIDAVVRDLFVVLRVKMENRLFNDVKTGYPHF